MARALYPKKEFNIVLYYPRGLDAASQDYSHLTAAVSFGDKIKHRTPTTKYKTILTCHSAYNKALCELLDKLTTKFLEKHKTLKKHKYINLL